MGGSSGSSSGTLPPRSFDWHWALHSLAAEVLTRTGAHVAVLCLPRLEPVGADWAEGTITSDLMEVEFNDKRVKIVDDVGAARSSAGEIVLAW
jgi:hypothetical protein